MKNGIALKGHKRILTAVGSAPARQRAPSGGWNLSCSCGWSGGNHATRALASPIYRDHLNKIIHEGLFTCKRCGAEKPASQMRPDYRYICLVCFSQIGNEWQSRNPEAAANHKRRYQLMKKFGLTLDEAKAILAAQGNACAICQKSLRFPDSPGSVLESPHVDHDHATGKVRGILCFKCNVGLGSFDDDTLKLAAAIDYINRSTYAIEGSIAASVLGDGDGIRPEAT